MLMLRTTLVKPGQHAEKVTSCVYHVVLKAMQDRLKSGPTDMHRTYFVLLVRVKCQTLPWAGLGGGAGGGGLPQSLFPGLPSNELQHMGVGVRCSGYISHSSAI